MSPKPSLPEGALRSEPTKDIAILICSLICFCFVIKAITESTKNSYGILIGKVTANVVRENRISEMALRIICAFMLEGLRVSRETARFFVVAGI